MAKVLVTEDYLSNIADAIRYKSGSSDTYTPADMAQAIMDIDGGGGSTLLLSQGQMSSSIAREYMTATFNSGVDLSLYDAIVVFMYENNIQVAMGIVVYSGTSTTFSLYGDRTYTMQLTSTAISCTYYSGSWRDLFVDVYGFNK